MPALELIDGGTLEYADTGGGRPLVFLHGWSLCKETFGGQHAALSDQFRVIAPDLRGHGRSSPVSGETDLETLAGDVAQLFAHLALADAVVVGWSMGAMLAWETLQGPAARRVAGIVTIDMVPRVLNDESWAHGLRAGRDASAFAGFVDRMASDWPSVAREYVQKIFARGSTERQGRIVEQSLRQAEDNDVRSMIALWNAMCEADYRDQVRLLEVPSLILYGEKSRLYAESASAWLRDNVPHSRRVGFPDSGHAPHLEEPDRFNRTITDFAHGLGKDSGRWHDTHQQH